MEGQANTRDVFSWSETKGRGPTTKLHAWQARLFSIVLYNSATFLVGRPRTSFEGHPAKNLEMLKFGAKEMNKRLAMHSNSAIHVKSNHW